MSIESRRPIREASTLPPHCYWAPEFYAREEERIFLREWLCVGRAEQVPEAGDFFSAEVCGRPLIVVREKGGGIRAHLNSCRHRGTAIVEGDGDTAARRVVVRRQHSRPSSCDQRGQHVRGGSPREGAFARSAKSDWRRGARSAPPTRMRRALGRYDCK